jgi:hypothetical protein
MPAGTRRISAAGGPSPPGGRRDRRPAVGRGRRPRGSVRSGRRVEAGSVCRIGKEVHRPRPGRAGREEGRRCGSVCRAGESAWGDRSEVEGKGAGGRNARESGARTVLRISISLNAPPISFLRPRLSLCVLLLPDLLSSSLWVRPSLDFSRVDNHRQCQPRLYTRCIRHNFPLSQSRSQKILPRSSLLCLGTSKRDFAISKLGSFGVLHRALFCYVADTQKCEETSCRATLSGQNFTPGRNGVN